MADQLELQCCEFIGVEIPSSIVRKEFRRSRHKTAIFKPSDGPLILLDKNKNLACSHLLSLLMNAHKIKLISHSELSEAILDSFLETKLIPQQISKVWDISRKRLSKTYISDYLLKALNRGLIRWALCNFDLKFALTSKYKKLKKLSLIWCHDNESYKSHVSNQSWIYDLCTGLVFLSTIF